MRRDAKPRRREQPPAPPPVVTPETVREQRAAGLLSRVTTLPLRPPAAVVTSPPPAPRASPGTGREGAVLAPPPTPLPPPSPLAAGAPPAAAATAALAPDVEATTVRPRHYGLRLPDQSTVPLTRRPTVLGRRSERPRPTPTAADVVTLDDPGRSLSRSHVSIAVGRDGGVWVTDLDSGNGTTLVSTTGEVVELDPGVPTRVRVGSLLSLGDHSVTIVRRRPHGDDDDLVVG